jgi:mannose-6-phosphate isomerase-like protein (cupin superfamily)
MTDTTLPTPDAPLVLPAGAGELIAIGGAEVVVKAAAPRVTFADYTAPAGFPGPPLHVHPAFDEVFYVLDGTLTVRLRDAVHEVAAGGTAFVPGAVPHTFANEAASPLRFLAVCAPGGFERYFRALAADDAEALAAITASVGYAPA